MSPYSEDSYLDDLVAARVVTKYGGDADGFRWRRRVHGLVLFANLWQSRYNPWHLFPVGITVDRCPPEDTVRSLDGHEGPRWSLADGVSVR